MVEASLETLELPVQFKISKYAFPQAAETGSLLLNALEQACHV